MVIRLDFTLSLLSLLSLDFYIFIATNVQLPIFARKLVLVPWLIYDSALGVVMKRDSL